MCTRGVNTFLSGFSPLSATAERNQLPMCSYVLCVWATHSMRCGVYMVAIPYRNGGTLDPGCCSIILRLLGMVGQLGCVADFPAIMWAGPARTTPQTPILNRKRNQFVKANESGHLEQNLMCFGCCLVARLSTPAAAFALKCPLVSNINPDNSRF